MVIEEAASEKFSPVPLLGKNNKKIYGPLKKNTTQQLDE